LRNYPKGGGPGLNAAFLAKRTPFGCFAEGSGRRQCQGIARSTGLQCRDVAVQDARYCRKHGGMTWALRKAQAQNPNAQRSQCKRTLRDAMARAGAEPPPEGFPERSATGFQFSDLNLVQRGKVYHRFKNRISDPKMWQFVFEHAHEFPLGKPMRCQTNLK
jgi:hypothetical protein